MKKNIQAPRGMKDYLPQETAVINYIEETFKNVFASYGYSEIRFPIIENSALFCQSIGEEENFLLNKIYTFSDKKGRNLALRPEGTSGCIRAGIERGFLFHKEHRLWYIGPMFRYERPQNGRYRQFYQIGAEVFGQIGPNIDAELIILTNRVWKILGISKYLTLEINSLGSKETKIKYKKLLINFLSSNESYQRYLKIYNNPIRMLDSKKPDIINLIKNIPKLSSYLDQSSKIHFEQLCKILKLTNIPYKINPFLVRGIGYYNRTVFEWIAKNPDINSTVCGGGRYDNLVKKLGGHNTPAVGFSVGLERLLILIKKTKIFPFKFTNIDIYLASLDQYSFDRTFLLGEKIRDTFPSVRIVVNCTEKNIKKHINQANNYQAHIMLIINEKGIKEEKVLFLNLLNQKKKMISQNILTKYLSSILKID